MLTVVVGLAGCGGVDAPGEPLPGAGATELAVVGDSITVADSPDLAGGDLGPESWVRYAVGEEVSFAGGWAQWGATTEQMVVGVDEIDADVLVILAGTNDVGVAEPFADTADNIEEIVVRSGVETVVLSAVPPIDAAPQSAVDLNARLQELALDHGWTWVPQPEAMVDGDRFAAGMAQDGLHPTEEGARLIGEQIGQSVRDLHARRQPTH